VLVTISALLADALVSLEIAIVIAVLVSYLVYLRDQPRTFNVLRRGIWQRAKTEIIITEQSASLSHLGKLWEMQLPSVIYFSEFLPVLSFRPEAEKGTAEIVIWSCCPTA
jgi:uncharacterized membrane protein